MSVCSRSGSSRPGRRWCRRQMGCRTCGVIAYSRGRDNVTLVDAPCFDRPVRLVWRKRGWRCEEPSCPTRVFTEQDPDVAAPRALLTTRACWWAINQIRREHASIAGLARQLGTTWNTVWTSIQPLLKAMADDETRFAGVKRLGVDEHVWHHVSEFPIADGGRGPKQLTGMVDLTPGEDENPRARLLDLVPGRPGGPTATGSKNAARTSRKVSRSPPSTRSTATRTPSTTSSRTPPRSSRPSTWSSSAPKPSTKSDAVSSKRSTATAAARTTRSTASGPSCAADKRSSPTDNKPGSTARSPPTNATMKYSSHGCAPNDCAPPTRPRTRSRAGGSQRKSSPRSRPARSQRSSDSEGH